MSVLDRVLSVSGNPKEVNNMLKKQDKQIAEMQKAEDLAKSGDIEQAIEMLERIMFKEGLLVRGKSWPYILYTLYIKNKMYDAAWKYLEFLYKDSPGDRTKIFELRAKILKTEKKDPIDAVKWKLGSLVFALNPITEEKFQKTMKQYLKNANFVGYEDVLYSFYQRHRHIKKESAFMEESKELLKKNKTI